MCMHCQKVLTAPLYVVGQHPAPCHTSLRRFEPAHCVVYLQQRSRLCIVSRKVVTETHNLDGFLLSKYRFGDKISELHGSKSTCRTAQSSFPQFPCGPQTTLASQSNKGNQIIHIDLYIWRHWLQCTFTIFDS